MQDNSIYPNRVQQDRRKTIKLLAAVAATSAAPLIVSCGSNSKTPDASITPDPTDPVAEKDWLVGATDKISVNYPEDTVFGSNMPCQVDLFPSGVEGPCYYHVDGREDISDGIDGLPMQVCIQVIDRQCRPLSGYTVEIWHCDKRGVYSGDSSSSSDASRFNLRFCTNNDVAAKTSSWGRGQLVTNSMGRVNFKSVFPGWYPGRTAHIHFRIKTATKTSVVSQLRFTDSFCRDIYTQHASYSARGNQDTLIPTDFEFTATDNKGFTLTQNSDGSLLAVKQIQVNV